LSSRTNGVFQVFKEDDFFDRSPNAGSNVIYTTGAETKEICLPDIGYIDIVSNTSTVLGWIVPTKDGYLSFLSTEMGRRSSDVEVPEDAVIQTAVHDDPFAY